MNNLFVPYLVAIQLIELDFNEPCLASYTNDISWQIDCTTGQLNIGHIDKLSTYNIFAPTWDQCILWFLNKKEVYINVTLSDNKKWNYTIYDIDGLYHLTTKTIFNTYEEARLNAVIFTINLCQKHII